MAQDGFYYNFYDFSNNIYEVIHFYVLVLIIILKVINMDLIVLLNADFFKHHIFYFLIMKLIFGRLWVVIIIVILGFCMRRILS